MKRPLQGVALILLGILLALLNVAANAGSFDIGFGLLGLILGIAGVIVSFLPDHSK